MAKSPKSAPTPPAAPEPPKAGDQGAGNNPQTETTEQTEAERLEAKRLKAEGEEAERKAAAQAEQAEALKDLADEQRQDIAAGGNGQEQADAARALRDQGGTQEAGVSTTGHAITDPKAAPVNLSGDSLRRPNQRLLKPEDVDSRAMPNAPAVNLPYGSEPRGIDPATGGPVVTKPEAVDEADVHHDDLDADTDRGVSASERAERASA